MQQAWRSHLALARRVYNPGMGLILASASPRRKALLETLGLSFSIVNGPEVDEAQVLQAAAGDLPARLMHLAQIKGAPVAQQYAQDVVLSADTVVVLDNQVLGKPRDAAEAQQMLSQLAGRSHEVLTAVCVQCAAQHSSFRDCAATTVTFEPLQLAAITRYIELTHPYDYAGGYAIQGLGAVLVSRINGDYNNVVGLPLGMTASLLAQAGYHVL